MSGGGRPRLHRRLTKVFPIGAAASLTTGFLLIDDFAKVHELAEWLAGFPIWTHQLPRMSSELRALALAQHPNLPTRIGEVTRENYQERILEIERAVGAAVLTFHRGDGSATQRNPIDELIDLVGEDRVFVVTP